MGDTPGHGEHARNNSERAYELAARCIRIAAMLQPLHAELESVGRLWAAADRARLHPDARDLRQRYQDLNQRIAGLRRAYRSTWRDLREVQRDWSDEQWRRYRAVIEERLADAPEMPPSARRVLAESARRESRLLTGLPRTFGRWWARLRGR